MRDMHSLNFKHQLLIDKFLRDFSDLYFNTNKLDPLKSEIETILSGSLALGSIEPFRRESRSRRAAKKHFEQLSESMAEFDNLYNSLSFPLKMILSGKANVLFQMWNKEGKEILAEQLIEQAIHQMRALRVIGENNQLIAKHLSILEELLSELNNELIAGKFGTYIALQYALMEVKMEYMEDLTGHYLQFSPAVENTIDRAIAEGNLSANGRKIFSELQEESSRLNLTERGKALQVQRGGCYRADGSIDVDKYNAYQKAFNLYKEDCEQFKELIKRNAKNLVQRRRNIQMSYYRMWQH